MTHAGENPLLFIDPDGLKKCKSGNCGDCPSGYWTVTEASTSVFGIYGKRWGTAMYRCLGSPRTCRFSFECEAVGGGSEIGVGVSGGYVGGEDCKCDEDYTPELSTLNIVSPTTGRAAEVIWFGSRPVADHGPDGPRYTFTDHLGTPILQTTSTASVVWRVEYEPFGKVHTLRTGSEAADQPLRFPGQQVAYRTATGEENYNIFRWYRARGRYTQADPIGIDGGMNLFAYVGGKPINASDPLGLKAELVCRPVKPGGWAGGVVSVVGFSTNFKPLHCRLRVSCPCSDGQGDPKAPFDKAVGWENVTGKGLTLTKDEYLAAGYDDGFFGAWFPVPVQSKASGCDFERSVLTLHKNMGSSLPPYNIMGPNSNSYVNHLIKSCGESANFPSAAIGGSPNPWYGGGGFN